ncbi:guanylate kinase [Candidatus Babeliales bacterium]|nr:guanylate kinase [Candidatus Babeliales bacterium]
METNANSGKLFVISAASGAGKTTLSNEAIKRLQKDDYKISKVITYTTRQPRPGEIDKKDYFFVSYEDFEEKLKDNFFLETTRYHGNNYGSPASILESIKLGESFILVTDLEGSKRIKNLHKNAIFIWINPPSLEDLRTRLITRKDLSKKQIEERVEMAQKEMEEAAKSRNQEQLFDYNITNDVFDQTIQELVKLIKTKI